MKTNRNRSQSAGDPANGFEAYFHNTIDCAFQLRVEPGPRFVYEAVNDVALAATGFAREMMIGRTPLEMLGPDKGRMMTEGLKSVWRTGEIYRYEPTWDLPGGVATYDASYIPIKDPSGKVIAIFGVARDITELRQLRTVGNLRGLATGRSGGDLGQLHTLGSGSVAPSSKYARLLRRFESVTALSGSDMAAVCKLPLRSASFHRGDVLASSDTVSAEACFIVAGVVSRCAMLGSGKRQIVALYQPGDLTNLDRLFLNTPTKTLEAISSVQAAFIPLPALRTLMELRPNLGDALVRISLLEKSASLKWTALMSQTAAQRVAHLISEYQYRLHENGYEQGEGFYCPLTQSDIGEAVGLSAVHVNRTMRFLERLGFVSQRAGTFKILDRAGLYRVAGFDPSYLSHHNRPVS